MNRSRTSRAALSLFLSVLPLPLSGCLDRPIEPVEPRTTSTVVERLAQSSIERMDVLLVVDDSRSMGDKQRILAEAVPRLVEGLLRPPCLDDEGQPASNQPPSPLDECPVGTAREFAPIVDAHVGIITTSLGAHGAPGQCGDLQDDRRAHLSTQESPEGGASVPTWKEKGFLAWDPGQKLSPAGDDTLEGEGGFNDKLGRLLQGAGQDGCGYESQLESFYRFLVDPAPFDHLELVTPANGTLAKAEPRGVDLELIRQRADFLRPDSLVAILMLTDENDCSIKDGGYNWVVASPAPMWRARAVCATDPNDPCCKPCLADASECPADPTCEEPYYADSDTADPIDLRCFDQKRRFGADFLQPISRYVAGLRDREIANADGQIVPNPLYADLDPSDGLFASRTEGDVFFAGIVGVPWQDVARNPADLAEGFRTTAELSEKDADGLTRWDVVLGEPKSLVLPLDPLMRESVAPRSGLSPIVGVPLAPPDAAGLDNPVNGHERLIGNQGDLQYTCIFPIPAVDCLAEGAECSVCNGTLDDETNPLCDRDASGKPTIQARAKAYPGLRQLEVLRDLGPQGIVASVCPAQTTTKAAPDYGYDPAIAAIVDRLKKRLGGQCLPRPLASDGDGQVACLILEASRAEGACDCGQLGREPVSSDHLAAVSLAASDPSNPGWDCFCEIPQLHGDALSACRTDPSRTLESSGEAVNGWCYVDEHTASAAVYDRNVAQLCDANEPQAVRFVGTGEPKTGSVAFITCAGE